MQLRPLRRDGAAVAVLAGAALAGCMGSGSSERHAPDDAGARIAEPVRLVDCRDWKRADVRERYGTVAELRRFASGPSGSPAGRGRALEDDKAYQLFESYCANDFASHFKLYKLYTRAAAFSRQRR
jgi:hypothetical protein